MRVTLKGLSKREIKLIAELEFTGKYYFTREEIRPLFENEKQMVNVLHILKKKGRIIKLNRKKYFLVPIKARIGKWTDDPFTIIDEALDGKDYYIGGWVAANYWRLTDQIPFRYDVYTTRRQGKYTLLGVKIIFHRTTKNNLKKAIKKETKDHSFLILNKQEARKWMKSRE